MTKFDPSKCELSPWAKYVACDKDGRWNEYENAPFLDNNLCAWSNTVGTKWEPLYKEINPVSCWKKTLTFINKKPVKKAAKKTAKPAAKPAVITHVIRGKTSEYEKRFGAVPTVGQAYTLIPVGKAKVIGVMFSANGEDVEVTLQA